MSIRESELILNTDGSVYHLNLKPENIAQDIIFVGDQDRVEKVTKHFDSIEFKTQKREFKTITGFYKNKRITVISTGIGPDNIDIVLNELDALVNIDLETRTPKAKLTKLNIVRIGTSGALQSEIPINSFLISTHALDINVKHTNWSAKKPYPIIIENNKELELKFSSTKTYKGITVTAGGFYGPQGRVLRLPVQDSELNAKINSFIYNGQKISNLEMETSAIYGLSKLLGHNAISMNAIIANRTNEVFSENPNKVIEDLILYTIDRIIN